jgi:hypothetical protein
MEMALPDNTLPMMTGSGPYGPMEMGGMFTTVKIRSGLARNDYRDPGPYQQPQRDDGVRMDRRDQRGADRGDSGSVGATPAHDRDERPQARRPYGALSQSSPRKESTCSTSSLAHC